jgi:two-component system, OmpR family, phosphate regulon sensor histidine kinase PhoR
MKRKAIKYIIILAIFSVAGIFMIQFGILKNTYDINEQQFHETATVALREVAWQLLEAAGQTPRFDNVEPVERYSRNYYLVNVNYFIDPVILKEQLREQFKRHALHLDFEYAIYDPDSETMNYMEYVCAGEDSCKHTPALYFPESEKHKHYFAVNFPTIKPYIQERLKGWYFMTTLLVVVLTFFGYSIWVIIKQRQLSEIQKVFINNLTHELKTPISSIGLAAHVISNEKIIETPDRLFNYVRIINEQSNRLAKNVEKVLSLASLEKNKIHLVKEEISLGAFSRSMVSRFKESEPGRLANLKINFPNQEIIVWADPFHLGNILQNILENAVKYCKNLPVVEISILVKRKHAHLMIKDNGIGIPKELRKKIFTKFYRVPTGNVHDVKGFGLGLDYVNKLVMAHRWKITVNENPEGGSIFTLIIPINHE